MEFLSSIITGCALMGVVVLVLVITRVFNKRNGGKADFQSCDTCGSAENCGVKKDTSKKSKYAAVFFDLDGTLIDSCEDLTAAVNSILITRGIKTLSPNEVEPMLGKGMKALVASSMPEDTSDKDLEKAYEEFVDFYKDRANILTKPYPGISEVINELHSKGYKLAVTTNKDDSLSKSLIEHFFPGKFDFVIGKNEVTKSKPDPGMLLIAASSIGVDLDKILYIGDSEVDYTFAKNAGVYPILVAWGYKGREALSKISQAEIIDIPQEIYSKL